MNPIGSTSTRAATISPGPNGRSSSPASSKKVESMAGSEKYSSIPLGSFMW